MSIVFWGIHKGHLSLKDVGDEQSNAAVKLKNLDKGKKQLKNSFLNNIELLFSTRDKALITLQADCFR